MNATPIFRRVALIGFGLIGGSIARAARAQGLASEIVTTARSEKTRARVTELGIVDGVLETNAEAVEDADLVILCIPVGACGPVAQEIAPFLKAGAIVSDVGSVKGAIVREMAPHLPDNVHFVPAHPVAGTEHSGPDSGFAELFINRWCILTPPDGSDPMAVETLRAFWAGMGAKVEIMTPDHHDLVLAITSHLPHLIAYTIVGTADELAQVTSSEVIKFSAGGFRDFTRIAASDPTMWRDVFLNNKEAVLEMLGTFNEDLSKLTRAIRRNDGEALFEHFTRTRAIRRGIVEIGQDSAAPDFGRPHPPLAKKAEWAPLSSPSLRALVARMSVAISGAALEESRIRFAHPGYETIPALHGMMREDRVPHHEPQAPSPGRQPAIAPIRCRDRNWDGRTRTFRARRACAAPRPALQACNNKTATKRSQGGYGDGMVHPTR